jgi:hypothetical protein
MGRLRHASRLPPSTEKGAAFDLSPPRTRCCRGTALLVPGAAARARRPRVRGRGRAVARPNQTAGELTGALADGRAGLSACRASKSSTRISCAMASLAGSYARAAATLQRCVAFSVTHGSTRHSSSRTISAQTSSPKLSLGPWRRELHASSGTATSGEGTLKFLRNR